MQTYRAARIAAFGGPEVVHVETVPKPEPKEGSILVRVHASGVNPVDIKIRQGAFAAMFEKSLPFALGGDIAGVVEAAPGVEGFAVGDAVFGFIGLKGAHGEYALAKPQMLAAKPANLSFVEAAAVPLAALTAWQGLFDAGGLQAGQTVLINAGAGGVGGFAVQLAHAHGARVIAGASAGNIDYVRSLGADEVVNYRTTPFADAARGVDMVFDLIAGAGQQALLACLKPGGILVSTLGVQGPEPALAGFRSASVGVRPDHDELAKIGTLFEAGKMRVTIAATYPLDRINDALTQSEDGHTRGKIVLEMG
jgi:NADPH:quinone reductase-like Zn-dependent oxidoreductase